MPGKMTVSTPTLGGNKLPVADHLLELRERRMRAPGVCYVVTMSAVSSCLANGAGLVGSG